MTLPVSLNDGFFAVVSDTRADELAGGSEEGIFGSRLAADQREKHRVCRFRAPRVARRHVAVGQRDSSVSSDSSTCELNCPRMARAPCGTCAKSALGERNRPSLVTITSAEILDRFEHAA